jgi:hypothetical protein
LPFNGFVIVPIPFNFNEVEIGAILAVVDDMKTNARMRDKIPDKRKKPKEKRFLGRSQYQSIGMKWRLGPSKLPLA